MVARTGLCALPCPLAVARPVGEKGRPATNGSELGFLAPSYWAPKKRGPELLGVDFYIIGASPVPLTRCHCQTWTRGGTDRPLRRRPRALEHEARVRGEMRSIRAEKGGKQGVADPACLKVIRWHQLIQVRSARDKGGKEAHLAT